MTHPCIYGLAMRPRRLFGFPMEPVDGTPCSDAGSITQGASGLPSIDIVADPLTAGNRDIQGARLKRGKMTHSGHPQFASVDSQRHRS